MEEWVKDILKGNDKVDIERAVGEAELITSAELVPMIVRRSSEPKEWIRGLFLGAFLGLSIAYICAEFLDIHNLGYLVFLCSAAGFWMASSSKLGRFFLTLGERTQASEIRAELEFYRLKVNKTEGGVGVLIFVSDFEHQVVILADHAIAKHHLPDSWDGICKIIINGLKTNRFGPAMSQAIFEIGKLCAAEFKPKQVNINEIEDKIVIKG